MRIHNGIEVTGQPIPKNKIKQWHDIMVATGGHYLANPYESGDVVYVSYAPGDYQLQWQLWSQSITEIRELRESPGPKGRGF